MTLPNEVPVMTLPNATLFPQALLPLYIFEMRYRQMLADALHGNRLLAVAMRKPKSNRETPAEIAGVGLIRVSVAHKTAPRISSCGTHTRQAGQGREVSSLPRSTDRSAGHPAE